MSENELIKKIRQLRQIEPRKDWVILTKRELFKQDAPSIRESFSIIDIFSRLFLNYKPVLATFAFLGVLVFGTGAFAFAKNALPGDSLYSLKRLSENTRTVFVSDSGKTQDQLELTNKRLEELAKIAATNQTQKLTPALNEVKKSVSEVAKDFKKPNKITKEIVDQTKKIEENRERAESLGVIIEGTEELDNALAQLVEREIKDLEIRSLTEEQQKSLEEVKADFEAESFTAALEKILEITSNNK